MADVGWGWLHAAGMSAPGPDARCVLEPRAWRGRDRLRHHAWAGGLAAQEQRRHFCESDGAFGDTVE